MKAKSLGGLLVAAAVGASAVYVASHIRVKWAWEPGATADAAPITPGSPAELKATLPPPSPSQVADARALSRTFSQVAATLSPSVVRISITKTVRNMGARGANPFRGTPFEHFFGDDDSLGGNGQRLPKQRGMGSGVVIDAKGYILTNNHVVEEADEVKVTFQDGKTVAGKVVGTDPKTDLAVVKVDKVEVRPARFGDSDKASIGEWVIAIGNPLGLDHTVTVGVLSAKGRSGFHSGNYEDFLQTDASINPGNSGGPLVNLDGEIIGINTMIAQGTGIGFAVPSSMARPIAEQLIKGGKVRRPWLGISMQDVTPEISKSLGDKAPAKGALVSQVMPDSPAAKAGVRPGDVIVSIDGATTESSKAVQKTVLSKSIGQNIQLGLWRDGKETRLAATTAELPGDGKTAPGESADQQKKLGLSLQTLTPDLASRVGVPARTKGTVITDVRDGSPAAEIGLRQGDVIVEVDRKAVTSGDEATRILATARSGGHLLRVLRGETSLFVVLPNE